MNSIIVVGNLDIPQWRESRCRVYHSFGLSPTLHGIGCGGNTEPKVLIYMPITKDNKNVLCV